MDICFSSLARAFQHKRTCECACSVGSIAVMAPKGAGSRMEARASNLAKQVATREASAAGRLGVSGQVPSCFDKSMARIATSHFKGVDLAAWANEVYGATLMDYVMQLRESRARFVPALVKEIKEKYGLGEVANPFGTIPPQDLFFVFVGSIFTKRLPSQVFGGVSEDAPVTLIVESNHSGSISIASFCMPSAIARRQRIRWYVCVCVQAQSY